MGNNLIDLKAIPKNPGVYIMKNSKEEIIYIGKAKNLKNRVSSYFNNPNSSLKTAQLVKNIHKIDFFICNSELEALILENNLIKIHQPKYNILLKDNKTYPYLKITNEKFPQISIVRSRKHLKENEKAYFFGPYTMNMKQTLNLLLKAFDLNYLNVHMYNKKIISQDLRFNNMGKDLIFEDKEYELKYIENMKNLIIFLKNKDKKIITKLHNQMLEYSENLEFEKAIECREKIEILKKLIADQLIEYDKSTYEDVFVFKLILDDIYITVLNIREGKIVNKNNLKLKNNFEQDEELFEKLFLLYYDNKAVPKNIVIQSEYKEKIEILKQWFKHEKNILANISAPIIKSRKLLLLNLGLKNLDYYIQEEQNKDKNLRKALIDLKEKLNLKNYPKVIECFDISNIQGKDPVAGMSVTVNGKADNKRYRHFKIRSKESPDDFLMMKEVIYRRYSKLEDDELPDLILIDGGKGQLNSAYQALKEIDKLDKIDLISIAKKEEELFKVNESQSYKLGKNNESLKILIRTRDEVHRFAITYHRKLRSKRNVHSILDEIKGIGPKRKKQLLLKYGTVKNILAQSQEELLKILPLNVVEKLLEIK